MTDHTENTPWKVEIAYYKGRPVYYILDAKDHDIFNETLPKAFAESLVRMVNSHAGLVEFAEDEVCDCYDEYNRKRPHTCDRCKALAAARKPEEPTDA